MLEMRRHIIMKIQIYFRNPYCQFSFEKKNHDIIQYFQCLNLLQLIQQERHALVYFTSILKPGTNKCMMQDNIVSIKL